MMTIFGIQSWKERVILSNLFYRSRIQFYPRHKYSLEVDQDFDLPTSPEFFKRRFKQMKSVLNL